MTHQMNQTNFVEILILGFENLREYKIPLFLFLLIIYTCTCIENLLIIFLVNKSPHLHSPMYFLISNLLFCELVYTTNLVPLMLHDLLLGRGVISYLGCVIQLNVLGGVSNVKAFLLTFMSYDRYLAIFKPLRYSTLISNRLCLYVIILFWLISFLSVAVVFYLLINLKFCGPVSIDHFYCDYTTLISIACSDISVLMIYVLVISTTLTLGPCLLIILSYVFIIVAILRIKSSSGRQKAFSTCSSHLMAVTLYFGTLFGLYVMPRSSHYLQLYKGLSFVYFAVTPLLNPIIYTLRNRDIHKAMKMTISKVKQYCTTKVH
ncbi:olfactory receptor 493-like [Rana temporaria]|uniref:olfactory receptor 493-like n=1 Tax=Rana temporaria TaxID=8407 RepID=UPI001AAD5FCC|nr:olfactory receptor 493-like [Rana temporaria]